jgi:hypothetical protein
MLEPCGEEAPFVPLGDRLAAGRVRSRTIAVGKVARAVAAQAPGGPPNQGTHRDARKAASVPRRLGIEGALFCFHTRKRRGANWESVGRQCCGLQAWICHSRLIPQPRGQVSSSADPDEQAPLRASRAPRAPRGRHDADLEGERPCPVRRVSNRRPRDTPVAAARRHAAGA